MNHLDDYRFKSVENKEIKPDGIISRDKVKTVLHSPWQNPYAERVIGSIRRDCLDQVIVLNKEHLHAILKSYIRYYHKCRTHLGLEGDCPEPRVVEPPEKGKIVAIPKVGGLHHFYERKAA